MIAVFGGANVDRKARSLAPLVPGTSNPARTVESFGGVGRNVAENLARLGLSVRLVSVVGDDAPGAALLAHASALRIDTAAVPRLAGVATGSYTAVLQPDGEMAVALCDLDAIEHLTPASLQACRDAWRPAGLRVVDLNLPGPSLEFLLDDSRRGGATLVAVAVSEPKMERLPARLDGLALLILNAGELAAHVGRPLGAPRRPSDPGAPGDPSDPSDPHRLPAVRAACLEVQAQGVAAVVVTLGASGLVCCDADGVQFIEGVPATEVVDVTGAGDAFAAGVVASLHDHPGDLRRACRLGQRLATLTICVAATVAPGLTPALRQAV